MLHELRIEGLLLIERAELRFGPGLNVITGETGAGKTVLAHALDLLTGGRARTQIVRPGAEEAYVEGTFSLPEGLLEDPQLADLAERLPAGADEITLARRVGASGRTSAYVQGRSATAADLRAIGSRVLAFTGQHEHRRLTLASAQLDVLDRFAGPEHLEERERHRLAHLEAQAAEQELQELREQVGARERDLDLLRYELEEIEQIAPVPGEVEALRAEREGLRHAEGLRGAAALAAEALAGGEEDGGASAAAGVAVGALDDVGGIDTRLDDLAERVRGLAIELADAASDLRRRAEEAEGDPARLQAVEERLEVLDRLERKHGGSIEAVLAHAERCREEIGRLEGAEERTGEVEERLSAARGRRDRHAESLRRGRREAAGRLEERMGHELAALAMEGAQLSVRFEDRPEGHGPLGDERVEVLVATNPGIEPAPLRDSASGGELSRVMLALVGTSEKTGGGTLVFDEIDAGIGGATARSVGERLRALGERRQVVCITHLPQVASRAAVHFRIHKTVGQDAASARVERVEGDELVSEIARMLGASEGEEAAERHARELLAA